MRLVELHEWTYARDFMVAAFTPRSRDVLDIWNLWIKTTYLGVCSTTTQCVEHRKGVGRDGG